MLTITDDSKLRVSFRHRDMVPCHSHTMSSIEIGKISVAGINGAIFADFRVNRPDTISDTNIVRFLGFIATIECSVHAIHKFADFHLQKWQTAAKKFCYKITFTKLIV